MKKIVVLIITVLSLSLAAFAQDEHFKFKGVEINGTVESFSSELENVGFSLIAEGALEGTFAGDDCTIYILSTKKGLVYGVCAVRSKKNSWVTLKRDFLTIKEGYIKKYGEPSSDVHRFSNPYYEGDGYEMTAVRTNNVMYACSWNFDNGKITEMIFKEGSVILYYTDKINDSIREAQEQQQFEDDL